MQGKSGDKFFMWQSMVIVSGATLKRTLWQFQFWLKGHFLLGTQRQTGMWWTLRASVSLVWTLVGELCSLLVTEGKVSQLARQRSTDQWQALSGIGENSRDGFGLPHIFDDWLMKCPHRKQLQKLHSLVIVVTLAEITQFCMISTGQFDSKISTFQTTQASSMHFQSFAYGSSIRPKTGTIRTLWWLSAVAAFPPLPVDKLPDPLSSCSTSWGGDVSLNMSTSFGQVR